MSNVEISIIVPCYNGAKFLREALDSAILQSHPPLEIIVIDDGSTDESASIARDYGLPVRLIQQPNAGESAARNRGIAEAKGTHLLFLDADDLLHREALARLSEAVQNNDHAVALMGCIFFKDDIHVPSTIVSPEGKRFFPRICQENLGAIHCWLTPTHLVRRVGGFEASLHYFEDWDFWARIGFANGEIVPVNFNGAYYRQFDLSQTRTAKRLDRSLGHAKVMERIIARIVSDRRDLLDKCAELAFWNGWYGLHRCRAQGASWTDVRVLAQNLERLCRANPKGGQGLFPRAVAWLGLRPVETARNWAMRLLGSAQKEE